MSWLSTSQKKGKRRAKNFTHERAQKRLNEALPIFQNQIENALNVDKVSAVIAKRLRTGRFCTCSKHLDQGSVANLDTELQDLEGNHVEMPVPSVHADGNRVNVKIDLGPDSLFGEGRVEQKEVRLTKHIELGDLVREEQSAMVEEHGVHLFDDSMTMGTGVDCGICYREGRQPAFEFTNYRQALLTTYDMIEISGYSLDQSTPTNFVQEHKDGYVMFEILVPKYFIAASYSVRDNTNVLGSVNRFYVGDTNVALKLSDLDAHRGRSIKISVRNVITFTHAILMFQLNTDSIQANISQENEVLNYEQEVTIGDISVVLPARVGLFRSEDFIIVPERNLVLKVNDNPRKSTADRQVWEWMANTRAVQRSEAQHNIFKHYKLY